MLISIIIPVYNEGKHIEENIIAIRDRAKCENVIFEFVLVDDGSSDDSFAAMQRVSERLQVSRLIRLSRNFGKEFAVAAGLTEAVGEACIVMDSDLQHPPTLISQMLSLYQQGKDVVTMVRTERADGGFSKHLTSKLFYHIINRLSDVPLEHGASDFFLISKKVIEVLQKDYRERTRFLRGIIQSIGFNKGSITYEAPSRAAGKSKYSLWKLLKLSFSAIASFSKTPLKIGIYLGLFFVLLSILLIIYSLVMWIVDTPISGYTTLIIFLSAFAGIQLLVTGAIGYYIGFIFDEVKQRPLYIIQSIDSNHNG